MKFDFDKSEIKKMFTRGKDPLKIIDDLSICVKTLIEDKERAWESHHKLREEYDKDEEVSKLKQELEDLRNRAYLVLNENEQKALKEFSRLHYDKCYKKHKGRTTHIEFYGTGIGDVIIAKCPCCGDAKDISDVDSW